MMTESRKARIDTLGATLKQLAAAPGSFNPQSFEQSLSQSQMEGLNERMASTEKELVASQPAAQP